MLDCRDWNMSERKNAKLEQNYVEQRAIATAKYRHSNPNRDAGWPYLAYVGPEPIEMIEVFQKLVPPVMLRDIWRGAHVNCRRFRVGRRATAVTPESSSHILRSPVVLTPKRPRPVSKLLTESPV